MLRKLRAVPGARDTEVSNLYITLFGEQDVFWLDVPMADVPFVYEGKGLQEFGEDEPEGLRVATITSSASVFISLRLG